MTATTPRPAPLLLTKLFVPQVRPDLVIRSRITQRLEEGLRRRLTLISAPAGFGKTTLVSSWHHADPRENVSLAWLSLDERDNDAGRFLTYLIEALDQAHPSLGDDARTLLTSAPNVSSELVVTQLINSISSLAGQMVLVLDDYHVIDNREIHGALDFLIEHLPPRLHIVMTSRTNPPLALARLRSRGEMIELRSEDLRFNVQETGDFLQHTLGRVIAAGDIRELEQRTEGWVAALQLAAISLRDSDDMHAFIHSFSGQHHHIVDFLGAEVLDRQPPSTQEFLLHTALFDRFSADLCDAVTDRQDSQAVLEYLDRSNLFISALDNERRWYRYHQLFADLLRRKLHQTQPDLIPLLHRRASIWFEAHDDVVEAIWQAIYATDWQRASELIEAHERSLFNRGQSRTLLQLTRAVPDEVARSRPRLLSTRAWAHILNGEPVNASRDLAALSEHLERIERDPQGTGALSAIPEAERHRLHGSLSQARAMNSILENDYAASVEFCAEALRQLPEGELVARSMTRGIRAQSLWLSGNLHGSADAFHETLELSKRADAPLAQIIALRGIGSIEAEWGQLDRAAQRYRQGVDYAAGRGLANWQYTGRLLAFQSELSYERNDLQEALEIAQRGREIIGYWANSYTYDVSHLQLARIHYARRDLDSARAALRQSPAYAGLGPGATDVAQIAALQARIELESGDRRRMAEIERELHTPAPSLPDHIWLWTPALRARAQVLNLLGRYAAAVALLAPVFDTCIEHGWIRQAIQSGAVLALSYQGQGDQPAATSTFEQVLAYAEPHGFLRSILDAGAGIDQVIEAVLERRRVEGQDTAYLDRLLQIARAERQVEPGARQSLIEPLSARELDVLRLIAAGHTNAEIADALFVVVGTVKAHAFNIYGKLGVRNRTQAVNRARELGLVD